MRGWVEKPGRFPFAAGCDFRRTVEIRCSAAANMKYLKRSAARLKVVVPVTPFVIFC